MLILIKILCLFLSTIVPLLISVAFFTLAERKLIASIQRRKGPNRVFFWGLLQPFADGLKAILKEFVFPNRIEFFYFILSPFLTFFISLLCWILIPTTWDSFILDYDLSLFLFFVLSSLGFYGILLAGWSSNSKYGLLGALRGVAQIVSYEIILGLLILPVILYSGSLNIIDLVYLQKDIWNVYLFFPLFLVFLVVALAETNRTPFDLPEAEAEIVAGYNIEYSGIMFALFFLGEYSNMLLNTSVITLIFLGGWLPPSSLLSIKLMSIYFIFKVLLLCFFWIFIRANLPRYRFDQLMNLGWKFLLPLVLCFFYLYINLGFFFEGLPYLKQIPSNQDIVFFVLKGKAVNLV